MDYADVTSKLYNYYSDILDYADVTSKLYNYIDSFKILVDVGSDHLPIFFKFKCDIDKNNTSEITDQNLNYNKANWSLFKRFLIKSASEIDTKISFNEFNKTVCEKILLAADKAIPKFSMITNKSPLQKFIINKIKKRRLYH